MPSGNNPTQDHSAEAAALGFYYQTFFALLTLIASNTDNAAVGIEQLDDVVLQADGKSLLFQLKHSISVAPPPITLKSRALWRTLKVWVDALPSVVLPETTFHLIVVAPIQKGNMLVDLTSFEPSRDRLASALTKEARAVIDARKLAKKNGNPLPYSDRFEGCEAFLALSDAERVNILRRSLIRQNSPKIEEIERLICDHLKLVHPSSRLSVAKRLIEWWDREAVYSLCGKRERVISRSELQQQLTSIISEIEEEELLPDFETVSQPENYQPDGMLDRQIRLVKGGRTDLAKAIREEWRARTQRSKWLNERPNMATVIGAYDLVLQEHWSDLHGQMVEDCANLDGGKKCEHGLRLLRWSHDEAPNRVRPIVGDWNAPYYIRGSYQVLAINLNVGWHPDYREILVRDK